MEFKNRWNPKWITVILGAVLLGLVVSSVLTRIVSPAVKTVQIANSSDWAKLKLILETVDAAYVDDIDQKELTEKIVPEILAQLDPHSVYLPPADLEKADEQLQGGFEGIGIQFNVPNDTAIVTNVIVGGPSERAGLMSGDRIVKVGDRVIAGIKFPQDSMVALMKGKRGTKVDIYVRRDSEELIPFTITRDKIPVHSIDVAFMLNDTTGYVKLSRFSRTSHDEFVEAASKLKKLGMTRLVFDLRDNLGGYLDQAMLLANEFLEKGDLVVYMEGKARPRSDLFADGRGKCKNISLAVLINEESASSSEIFAGAMQDNDRGTIYGVRSFGKGLVQEPVNFSDGSGIRLTVARFYTPSGRCIQKPYGDYDTDIYDRYSNGEFFNQDSIKVNDSLKYTTKGGRTVYGGGGIIPDVFVPLDTVGVTNFMVKCNRLGLQIKYANMMADTYRQQLRGVGTLEDLDRLFADIDLKGTFLSFAASLGVVPQAGEWETSGDIILTQAKALIGRYTPMGDDAFYPIYLQTDKLVQKATEDPEASTTACAGQMNFDVRQGQINLSPRSLNCIFVA